MSVRRRAPAPPPGTVTGGPAHDDVMAWVQAPSWPLLGYSTIAPMNDKDCLLHLAERLESTPELDARDRYFLILYLRRFASTPGALKALCNRRGRPAGQAWNKALHFAVCSELSGDPIKASEHVAHIWGGGARAVRDSEHNAAARREAEDIIAMRLRGPSYHPQPDGSAVHKEWTRREILEALDTMLKSRAADRKK